jgi:small subunit ribosomal protein S4
MARYTDAKCRICRREGIKLFLKGDRCYSPKCPIERKGALIPGQHGQKRRRRQSDYGRQLREKQKTKRFYGVLERQFKKYFNQAAKKRGEVGERLLELLERRLDNVVFRLGLAPSRSVARQLVSHGHVLVDGKKVNIPSYQTKPGQVISFLPKALAVDLVKKSLDDKERKIPEWLEKKAGVGKVNRLPKRDEVDLEVDEHLIVEFYSR